MLLCSGDGHGMMERCSHTRDHERNVSLLCLGERTCWNHHHCTTNFAILRTGCLCPKTNSALSNFSVMVARTIIPAPKPNPAESMREVIDFCIGDPGSCRTTTPSARAVSSSVMGAVVALNAAQLEESCDSPSALLEGRWGGCAP